ncbi:MAG: tRNA lysidine(34) synthetase TilS [Lachnospiraceae bacterium]|nr:tRNA lysidine(34) synthetase TilS [Lachnospiraceae bacterium]
MDYIKKYQMISPHDTITAGISGGADSVCLLFMLLEIQKQIPFALKVVHVNHQVRGDADRDEAFVRELCRDYQIPFYPVTKNVRELAKEWGCSEEEAGRKIRYQAFEEVQGADVGKIAVAHNSNDRAETMLFHLFRGTGLGGASGIRPVNGRIIRPLLGVTREEIENWLRERGIAYCTDSTNQEDAYTRNRIRHHILPYAEREICRGAVVNMNRAADELMMAEEYLRRETGEAAERCILPGGEENEIRIQISALEKEDEYLMGRIILLCLERTAGSKKDLTAAHVRSVERLFRASGSKELHLPYQITVYKEYDVGIIRKESKAAAALRGKDRGKDRGKNLTESIGDGVISREQKVEVPGEITVPGLGIVEFTVFLADKSQNIPEKTYTKWFDYDKISSSMVFRTRQAGDYLTVKDSRGEIKHKLLQDYLVNEKIPKQERERIYLLAEGSHIIWIPGRRISEHYKIVYENAQNACRVLQVKVLDKEE